MEQPTRIYTGGTFDLFHSGHVEFLKRACSIGNVIVSLNRDEFVERFKGRRPVMPLEERIATVRSCRYVKDVVINTGDEDSTKAIIEASPDIVAIGTDWLHRDYCKQMGFDEAWLHKQGISLLYIPYTPGISTTELKRRIVECPNS